MATHPYISGVSNIEQMIVNLRRNFPTSVTSETVKKFGLASNNESYVINALQFVGLLDAESKRTEKGHAVLLLGENEFKPAFAGLVKDAYHALFDLHAEGAWTLTREELIVFFRTTDKTSDVIGKRQAMVFQTFAGLAGFAAATASLAAVANKQTKTTTVSKTKMPKSKAKIVSQGIVKPDIHIGSGAGMNGDGKNPVGLKNGMALTVRIEINLPAGGSQETYDNIFKSIRANLIND
jgi:Family of unknown function (DUF5343)